MSDDPVTTTETVEGRFESWGSLKILEEIGRGGFGVVYRAWEPTLAREVALKVIRPRPGHGADALAAILREGQLLARIRHPNVVTVHGAMQVGDEVGIWMEFVRGKPLAQLVRDEGPRAADEAAVIGVTLCQALVAVHRAEVLHRDIKANNVMRETGGRIVLMDFGAGQVLDGPRQPEERTTGTPAYMAPEVLAGGKATVRSDIYSLGVLLYHLVTGTYPVEGQTWTDFLMAHARFERRPLGDVRPDISPRFVRIVERATAINPDERYASAGAMQADLLSLVGGGAAAPVPRRPTRTESRKRKAAQPRRAAAPVRIAAWTGGVLLGIWILGAVSTLVFNNTLSRPVAYANEPVLLWGVWGIRALIPGAVYATAVILLLTVLTAFWRVARRLSSTVSGIATGIEERGRAAAAAIGLNDSEMGPLTLLAAQILALAGFCWYFRDILASVASFIDSALPGELEALRPEYLEHHQRYVFALAILIAAMGFAAYRVARLRRQAGLSLTSGSMLGVFGLIAISLLLVAVPYRLMWHNRFERVTYGSQRCYILGEQSAAVLLYCPGIDPPRVMAAPVPAGDLQRSGVFENIYTR